MKRIILVGMPGAGKGTQSAEIEKKFGYKRISTGDLIRNEINLKTEMGQKFEVILKKGELVSDEIVLRMIKTRLEQKDIDSKHLLHLLIFLWTLL